MKTHRADTKDCEMRFPVDNLYATKLKKLVKR